jgi:hypothetical protein
MLSDNKKVLDEVFIFLHSSLIPNGCHWRDLHLSTLHQVKRPISNDK